MNSNDISERDEVARVIGIIFRLRYFNDQIGVVQTRHLLLFSILSDVLPCVTPFFAYTDIMNIRRQRSLRNIILYNMLGVVQSESIVLVLIGFFCFLQR